jgi:hypothetical protein
VFYIISKVLQASLFSFLDFNEYALWYIGKKKVESQFRNLMQDAYQLDFIRMPIVEVNFNDKEVVVTAKLLQKPLLNGKLLVYL